MKWRYLQTNIPLVGYPVISARTERSLAYLPDEVEALKEFRQERKEYLHKKNETIKKKGSGREAQVIEFSVFFLL